jgi:hypothetical protein
VSAELIETAARALGPLLEEMVFLGVPASIFGSATPAHPRPARRMAWMSSAPSRRVQATRLAKRLCGRGFGEASDSPVNVVSATSRQASYSM